MKSVFCSLTLVAMSLTAMAHEGEQHWQLDNQQSALHFVSVKKDVIAETHRFTALQGEIDSESNQLTVVVDLSSVSTGIEIRDSRMKEFLFNTAQFPKAKITADLTQSGWQQLAVGAQSKVTVELAVALHGVSKVLPAQVVISKLSNTTFAAHTASPIMLNAADFALTDGVNKLKELAALPAIAVQVPVTFSVVFNSK